MLRKYAVRRYMPQQRDKVGLLLGTKKMKHVAALIASACLAFLAGTGQAAEPKLLEWEDFIPTAEPLKDPLDDLTPDQQYLFQDIVWARTLGTLETSPDNNPKYALVQESEEKLRKQGINIEEMYSRYKQWLAELERRGTLVKKDLDGELIRVAGYLLPLEFSEEGETEFLLVPYIGACIHVPPPPPNQIVFVTLKEKFNVKDLFTPVLVTGVLSAKSEKKPLALADGTANVTVGYSVAGEKVEPYEG